MEKSKDKQSLKIKAAVKDILWMARRYANNRLTYSPMMFNDAYDTLREYFGDDIDSNYASDGVDTFYDIAIPTSKDHPYAVYGHDNSDSTTNREIKDRKFCKKP